MEETGPDDNGAESGSGVRASGEAAEEEMRRTAAGEEKETRTRGDITLFWIPAGFLATTCWRPVIFVWAELNWTGVYTGVMYYLYTFGQYWPIPIPN